jgi:predicted ATPase
LVAQVTSPVMVGRDAELSRLEHRLRDIESGDGRLVVLSGEAGVDKSRLVAEVRRRARDIGYAVLLGECSESDLAVPYLPFVEAIVFTVCGARYVRLRNLRKPGSTDQVCRGSRPRRGGCAGN